MLTIPAAYWTGRSLFDRRVGWTLAGLAAFCPFLTSYAQETRMYSLVVLLGTLATAFYLHAFVFGRRRYRIPLGLTLAAMLYTHNWTFFLIAGMVVAGAIVWRASDDRRQVLRDGAIVLGAAGLLYLAWVPSLVFQALHTGAPWAMAPGLKTLEDSWTRRLVLMGCGFGVGLFGLWLAGYALPLPWSTSGQVDALQPWVAPEGEPPPRGDSDAEGR